MHAAGHVTLVRADRLRSPGQQRAMPLLPRSLIVGPQKPVLEQQIFETQGASGICIEQEILKEYPI